MRKEYPGAETYRTEMSGGRTKFEMKLTLKFLIGQLERWQTGTKINSANSEELCPCITIMNILMKWTD